MKDKPHNRESSQNKRSRPEKGAEKKNANLPENEKERTDERLDEGVEETFPASDPVSVSVTAGLASSARRWWALVAAAGAFSPVRRAGAAMLAWCSAA